METLPHLKSSMKNESLNTVLYHGVWLRHNYPGRERKTLVHETRMAVAPYSHTCLGTAFYLSMHMACIHISGWDLVTFQKLSRVRKGQSLASKLPGKPQALQEAALVMPARVLPFASRMNQRHAMGWGVLLKCGLL